MGAERSSDREHPIRVLVVLAHPDDPEFFCGGTIARWTAAGREVHYCLLTSGDKGAAGRGVDPKELAARREAEQRAAAEVLGVQEVRFLGYPDGYLTATLELRRDIVRVIRQVQPQVLVTCDPSNIFPGGHYINHADHRAAGEAALDAVFPASRSALYFPELLQEGLEPHKVSEVYVAGARDPNLSIDVTAFIERKLIALSKHSSQLRDLDALGDRLRQWMLDPQSPPDAPRYVERYLRIALS